MNEQQEPFKPLKILQDYERRSLVHAVGMSGAREDKPAWTGVLFKILDYPCIASIGAVEEVVSLSDFAPVFGAKHWLLGIANNRGQLVPVIDAGGFISDTPRSLPRLARMMIVKASYGQVALVVDQVMGQKHFQEEPAAPNGAEPEALKHLTSGFFDEDNQRWNVFDVGKLVELPEFTQAAA